MHRLSRLFDGLAQARADGTYLTALRRLAKVQVLVLDDFGLEPLGAAERKVLLEVLEDRYGLGATIITSQLDPKDWHPVIGDETVADAICDRLVHGAHRIKLTGESMRKGLTNGTNQTDGGVDAERLDERDEASEVERPSVATLRGVRLDRYGCSASLGIGDRLRPEWAFDSAGIRTEEEREATAGRGGT